MAYFPNGSSGDCYMGKYCMNCRHWKLDEEHDIEGCPIWDLHMIGDYDQCAKTEIGKLWKSLLEALIPTQENGIFPDKCTMFIPVGGIDLPGQIVMDFVSDRNKEAGK